MNKDTQLLRTLYLVHTGNLISLQEVGGKFSSYYDGDIRYFATDCKDDIQNIEDEVLQEDVDFILDTVEDEVTFKVAYYILCLPENVEFLKKELRMDYTFDWVNYSVKEVRDKIKEIIEDEWEESSEDYSELFSVLEDYDDDEVLYLVTVSR